MYDIIIVGMGIAGISAGIYAKRSGKKVLLIDSGTPGGLLNIIDKVSNYPGLPNISGMEFASNLLKQVKDLEIPFVYEEVISLDLGSTKRVITKNNEYETENVILAMGRKPKYLGLNKEKDLIGKGLSTCALCDAFFYKDKDIAVVGSGDSALQESLYLANIVRHIYLINRREDFRGAEELVRKVKENKKIEIIKNASVVNMNEENECLKSIDLSNGQTLDVSGLFIYVGYRPASEIVNKELLDSDGYVVVDDKYETNIKGVFAIGDIIKKDTYQLITAASDGARVIKNNF